MPQVQQNVVLLNHTYHPQELVAMAAKLCYSDSDIADVQAGVEARDQARFIGRLTEMGHLSPIEHASFTFGLSGVSRSLLAQITRHRLASFSVQSQRYVGQRRDAGEFNYIVPPAIEALGPQAVEEYGRQMNQMQNWYNKWSDALGNTGEQSNEDARFVLPNAAETRIIVTMNARELIHFFSLRCCNRAQWEIREAAWKMLGLCREAAPALFGGAGPGCLSGPCPEGRMCCGQTDAVRARSAALNGGN